MAAVEALVNEFTKRSNIEVSLTKLQIRNFLPQSAKTALYRVTQEALMNIERHASASKVNIEFKMTPRWFKVIIEDDGSGFDVHSKDFVRSPSIGIGLRNMDERLSYFKGRLNVESNKGQGTKITAAIPKNIFKGWGENSTAQSA